MYTVGVGGEILIHVLFGYSAEALAVEKEELLETVATRLRHRRGFER